MHAAGKHLVIARQELYMFLSMVFFVRQGETAIGFLPSSTVAIKGVSVHFRTLYFSCTGANKYYIS